MTVTVPPCSPTSRRGGDDDDGDGATRVLVPPRSPTSRHGGGDDDDGDSDSTTVQAHVMTWQ